MGGDGGTKSLERKYMRQANKQSKLEKPDAGELRMTRMGSCALSNAPLVPGEAVVACRLGQLYVKEVLLRHLLEKTMPVTHAHVRGLSDVVDVRFHPNPALAAAGARPSEHSYWSASGTSAYTCRFTGLEYGGRTPFCVIFPIGAVVSQRAVNELGVAAIAVEIGQFDAAGVVELNQSAAVMERRRAELLAVHAARRQKKLKKKQKKKKKRKREEGQSGSGGAAAAAGASSASSAAAPRAKAKAKLAGWRAASTVDAARAARPGKASKGHASKAAASAATAKVDASRTASSAFASIFHKDGGGGVVGGKNDINLFCRVATFRGLT